MSHAKANDPNSIATHVQACLDGFIDACSELIKAEPSMRQKLSPDFMYDGLGRFRLWVGNIGAHRIGRASLDHKLREASHIRVRVVELLQNLETVLQETREIITGARLPWEDLSDSDSDMSDGELSQSGDELPSELAQLASNIVEINGCLMRLSLAIRNPAPHDQFKESAQIDVTHFETFDIEHVRGKFPFAAEYLVLRLGKAISRRRHYLRYRQNHRKKLEQGLKPQPRLQELIYPLQETFTAPAPSEKIDSTVASSIPLAIKASTSTTNLDDDDYYEDSLSQTSYASSNSDPCRLRPPPLPADGRDGHPFECPLCFRFTSVRQTPAWHKHVYRDLQPYVCTYNECKVPDQTYESRHDWFQHELQHRTWWQCISGCNVVFRSLQDFHKHLDSKHGDLAHGEKSDDLVRNCERQASMDIEAQCLLCHTKQSSLTQLRRHLGKHQEELSLFVLPSHMKEDHNDDDEDQAEIDLMSSVTGSEPSLSPKQLTCDLCGLSFDDDNKQEDLAIHLESSHSVRRNRISSLDESSRRFRTAKVLLHAKPSVVQAMDEQIFDTTLLHSDLRVEIPGDVSTWMDLKQWLESREVSGGLGSGLEHIRILQAVQFQTTMFAQETDDYFERLKEFHQDTNSGDIERLYFQVDGKLLAMRRLVGAMIGRGDASSNKPMPDWQHMALDLGYDEKLTEEGIESLRLWYERYLLPFENQVKYSGQASSKKEPWVNLIIRLESKIEGEDIELRAVPLATTAQVIRDRVFREHQMVQSPDLICLVYDGRPLQDEETLEEILKPVSKLDSEAYVIHIRLAERHLPSSLQKLVDHHSATQSTPIVTEPGNEVHNVTIGGLGSFDSMLVSLSWFEKSFGIGDQNSGLQWLVNNKDIVSYRIEGFLVIVKIACIKSSTLEGDADALAGPMTLSLSPKKWSDVAKLAGLMEGSMQEARNTQLQKGKAPVEESSTALHQVLGVTQDVPADIGPHYRIILSCEGEPRLHRISATLGFSEKYFIIDVVRMSLKRIIWNSQLFDTVDASFNEGVMHIVMSHVSNAGDAEDIHIVADEAEQTHEIWSHIQRCTRHEVSKRDNSPADDVTIRTFHPIIPGTSKERRFEARIDGLPAFDPETWAKVVINKYTLSIWMIPHDNEILNGGWWIQPGHIRKVALQQNRLRLWGWVDTLNLEPVFRSFWLAFRRVRGAEVVYMNLMSAALQLGAYAKEPNPEFLDLSGHESEKLVDDAPQDTSLEAKRTSLAGQNDDASSSRTSLQAYINTQVQHGDDDEESNDKEQLDASAGLELNARLRQNAASRDQNANASRDPEWEQHLEEAQEREDLKIDTTKEAMRITADQIAQAGHQPQDAEPPQTSDSSRPSLAGSTGEHSNFAGPANPRFEAQVNGFSPLSGEIGTKTPAMVQAHYLQLPRKETTVRNQRARESSPESHDDLGVALHFADGTDSDVEHVWDDRATSKLPPLVVAEGAGKSFISGKMTEVLASPADDSPLIRTSTSLNRILSSGLEQSRDWKFRIQKDRLISWDLEWRDDSGDKQGDIGKIIDQKGLPETVTSVLGTIKEILCKVEQLRTGEFVGKNSPGENSKAYAASHPPSSGTAGQSNHEDLLMELTTSIDVLYEIIRTRRMRLKLSAFQPSPESASSKKGGSAKMGEELNEKVDQRAVIDPRPSKSSQGGERAESAQKMEQGKLKQAAFKLQGVGEATLGKYISSRGQENISTKPSNLENTAAGVETPEANKMDTKHLKSEASASSKAPSKANCTQVVERYAICRCLYYKHAIDPYSAYGQRGHTVKEKTVLVGYACSVHSNHR